MTRRIQPWRRRVHYFLLAIFVGLPFLRIGGESALRFDVPSLRLHLFGAAVRIDEFFTLLLALFSLTFFFIWLTVVYGRIWCGWLCPQTVLVDLTGPEGKRKKGLRPALVAQLRILIVSAAAGAVTVWYFVSPYNFFRHLAAGSLGPVPLWSWVVLSALIWLDLLLVRFTFCATVCPYSRLQGVMFDRQTLAIAFDETRNDECIECSACVKACPVGIDIRRGLQAACVNCTECIDTCARIMARKKTRSLVGFFYGGPGGASRPWRPAGVIPLGAALLFLALFIIALAGRPELEATLLPRHEVFPRLAASGRVINSFELSVENRDDVPLILRLSAESASGAARLSPGRIKLDAGEHRRLPLTLSADSAGPVDIIIEGAAGPLRRLPATILSPER